MTSLERSWGAFTPERARGYLQEPGAASPESQAIVADVLRRLADKGELAVLDLGCGNGATLRYLVDRGVPVRYTGVDFSEPLLEAAREASPDAVFIRDDVQRLERVEGRFDVVLYSHVLEMLGSPQASLERSAQLASTIVIRFFEPPDGEVDTVELLEMNTGAGRVPYLRRTMSRDYYRMLLARIGCKNVDIYRCEFARDQVHVCTLTEARGDARASAKMDV